MNPVGSYYRLEGELREAQQKLGLDACITFGTKTYPLVLFSALRCIDKLLQNVEIKGIYYQEITRRDGKEDRVRLYDVSALFTLDSIADLAAGGITGSAKDFLHLLLNPSHDK